MASTLASKLPQPGIYREFMPQVGTMLIVQLPGETMRCPVEKVVSPDAVIVKIDTVPMAKSHSFRLDDMVGVRRRSRDSRDYWEAQTDRDFLAEQKRIVAARPKPAELMREPVVPHPAEPAKTQKPLLPKPVIKKKPAGKRVGKGKKGRAA